jgi:hypothetical protein
MFQTNLFRGAATENIHVYSFFRRVIVSGVLLFLNVFFMGQKGVSSRF